MKVHTTILFLIISFLGYGQTKPDFVLKIQNIKNTKGTLRIAFYKKGSNFPDNSGILYAKEMKIIQKGEMILTFSDIGLGEYAMAIFHDENGNKKLDKNLLGVPTEPYGFSRNFKPKFSAPKYTDCNVDFSQTNNSFTIKLLD
jgi:uncharacterized protein (DUF2141 family)